MNRKIFLILGLIIIILGFMIIPNISMYIFRSYVCGHYNMYLVGFTFILLGIYIIFKEIK